jgi:Outer membrane protein beta-barrel domain
MKNIHWFETTRGTARIVVFTRCCTGAFAPSASAQTPASESSTRGFSLGGHAAVIGSNSDAFDLNGQPTDPPRVTVAGGGVMVAYGATEWLTVTLNGDGHESGDDRHLSFGDIGAQFFLPGWNRLLPHFDVALTGRRAEFEAAGAAIDTRGAGLSVGGGVLYFLSRSFALDATLLRTAGDLDRYADGERVKDVGAIDVSGTRFLIGVRWYPWR